MTDQKVASDCLAAFKKARNTSEWMICVFRRVPPVDGGPWEIEKHVFQYRFPTEGLGECIEFFRQHITNQGQGDGHPEG